MKKLFKSLFLPLLLGIIVSIAAAGCGNQNDELLESVRKRFGRDAILHGVTVEKIENGRVYYTAKYGKGSVAIKITRSGDYTSWEISGEEMTKIVKHNRKDR